jgi:integrase
MLVTEFVEEVYLPEYIEKRLRPASLKQCRNTYQNHLKGRLDKLELTLRSFRTLDGERMLAEIAEQAKLGRSSLRHCKVFLSGAFKQAKRLGILDGINPMMDTSIPKVPETEEDTYAYSLAEIKAMLAVLAEPARTIVLTAAFTGLRKGEILGLRWQDFNGQELSVNRSIWNGIENAPKTKGSKASIPVVKLLAEALEAHRLRCGILAQKNLPIFQAGNGSPLNLDNLARRVIATVSKWHGWHAFRRGLATNLHALGVADRDIQAIMRHSDIGLTQRLYIKSTSELQVSAMDSLSEKFSETDGTCNDLAMEGKGPVN